MSAPGLHRCRSCGAHLALAPTRCPGCRGDDLEAVTASGRGRLVTWTTVHRAPLPELRALVPYVIGLVDLAEGARVMVRVSGDAADLAVGAPGRVERDEGSVLHFHPG